MLKKTLLAAAVAAASVTAQAAPTLEEMWELVQQQQAEIAQLKSQLNKTETKLQETDVKVTATADAVEQGVAVGGKLAQVAQWAEKTTVGGYGEHHFNHFEDSNDQVDAHRYVMFFGHQFTDDVRFFSELEVEHGFIADENDTCSFTDTNGDTLVQHGEVSCDADTSPGEVELEQAYIEWDYTQGHGVKLGQFLVPVGILNETHEPDTFYGTERNQVEKNIIPVTWWETGVMLQGEIAPGLTYNAGVHSGFAASEGGSVRGGRQKSAKATAEDLAYTARLKYTGIAGLELAATVQMQEEITQGAAADDSSATLWEAHAVYNHGPFGVRALYASWDIDGDGFEANGSDEQEGWYIEPSYKLTEKLGLFARYSEFNNKAGVSTSIDTEVWDFGLNYWLTPNVVLKADYTDFVNKNTGTTDKDALNLGIGWSF